MNELVPQPEPPARKPKRRVSKSRALVKVANASGRILALPPSDESAPQRAWRPGVFGVLDIGSTKMTCLIGRGEPDGTLRVLGYGWRRSRGVRAGAIVDLKEAEAAIRATVGQAEEAAERKLEGDQVAVNLSCGQPESRLFNARLPVGGREVTASDMRRVLSEGRVRAQTEGRAVVHTLPISFTVDETQGVADPIGHFCDMLTARLHVIDAASTALSTLDTVLARAELRMAGLISSPFASGLSVLDADERELGATVVEMGGGTTSLAVFGEGRLLHTAHLPIGGLHVTRDIAGVLSTSLENAERLKTVHGAAELSSEDQREMLPLTLIGDDSHTLSRVSRARLVSVIRPRIEETLELLRDRLDNAGLGRAAQGRVVLTGGASLLEGIGPMAARVLNRDIRLGRPLGVHGLPESAAASAGFSTAAGLLAWAARAERPHGDLDAVEQRHDGLLRRLVGFIRDRV